MPAIGYPAVTRRLFPATLQQAVRERFCYPDSDPFSGPRIYLENAGGGLTLKAALEADQQIASLPDNSGRNNPSSQQIDRVLRAGREDLALFFNAPGGTVLSEQSTTACAFRILEAAAAGTTGTNLVCSRLDHASFFDAARAVAERHRLELRIAPLNRATGALDIPAVTDLVDSGTVAVTLIHASNITGGKTDLIGAAAAIRRRAPQALIVADGAQHAQHGPIDVAASGVDAYVFSAYKVFSKAGFAFAYLSPRLAARPHAQLLGKKLADWDLGTRDAGGFAAFSRVIDYLCWLGAEAAPVGGARDRRSLLAAAWSAIESHEAALSERLLQGAPGRPGLLASDRVQLHGRAHPTEGREAVFAFTIPPVPTGRIVAEFGRRGVVVHDRVTDAYSGHTLEALGPKEVVRVSFAHYNTLAEVDQFLNALQSLLPAP